MTKQEYERAIEAGRLARQAGRKRESCPMFGMGSSGDMQRDAWRQGFDDEDARRRK